MNILQQLLAEAKPHKSKDLSELVDYFIDANKIYSFEGDRGVKNFEKIVKVMGYDNLDKFLSDNSGCLEAMVEWIKDARVPEWVEKFQEDMPVEANK